MTKRTCGSCTMCCKTMGVPDLQPKKLPHVWCSHCEIGKGCTIYDQRPKTCREFECIWLQDTQNLFGDDCRPDRLGVVFVPADDGMGMIAHCDPAKPTAWRHPKAFSRLRACAAAGFLAGARAGARFWVVGTKAEWEATPDCVRYDGNRCQVRLPANVKREIGFFLNKPMEIEQW